MTEKSRIILFHIVAAITATIWGTTFISTKLLLLNGLSPIAIFLLRFTIAYIIIIALCPKPLIANTHRDELMLCLAGLFGGSLYFLAENTAIGLTMTSNVSLIICTAPLLTVLLSHYAFGTPLGRRMFIGSFIALIGVGAVVLNGNVAFEVNPVGDFLTFIAALMWAVYSIILAKLSGKYSTLFITRKVFFYGLISMGIFALIDPITINFDVLTLPIVLYNLLFLGIVASMLCFLMWNKVVSVIGATTANNYIYTTPMVTMITSYIVLDEPITILGIIGAISVIVGVYLAQRK